MYIENVTINILSVKNRGLFVRSSCDLHPSGSDSFTFFWLPKTSLDDDTNRKIAPGDTYKVGLIVYFKCGEFHFTVAKHNFLCVDKQYLR